MNKTESNQNLLNFAAYPSPNYDGGTVFDKLESILSAGADPTVENSYVLDLIANAPRSNNHSREDIKRLTERLIEAGADPGACPQALVSAIKNDRPDVAYLLISKGADVHAIGDLAMGYAIVRDQTHTINYISDAATRSIDVTPFLVMYCNETDDYEFIEDMLEHVAKLPNIHFDESQFIGFLTPAKAAYIQKKQMTQEALPATSRRSARRSLGSL